MTLYALRLQNSTDTAPRVRMGDSLPLQHEGVLAARSGLRRDGGGEVSAVAGSMAVQVTPFLGWLNGGTSDAQAGYPVVLDATETLTLEDGDATLARTDTIAVVIREDAFDGSGSTDAALVVVKGTPGAGAPVLPDTALPLRDVSVPAGLSAGTGGLSASNLGSDRRQYLTATGGILPVSGATERDVLGAVSGQAVYRMDTGALELFNGTSWDTYAKQTTVPYLQVTGSTFTIAPGETKTVQWQATSEAQGGASVSGPTLTFGPAGLYVVSAQADMDGTSGTYAQMFLVNAGGGNEARSIGQRATGAYETLSLSKTFRVAEGQTFHVDIQVAGSNNGTATVNGGSDRLYLTAVRVGD